MAIQQSAEDVQDDPNFINIDNMTYEVTNQNSLSLLGKLQTSSQNSYLIAAYFLTGIA